MTPSRCRKGVKEQLLAAGQDFEHARQRRRDLTVEGHGLDPHPMLEGRDKLGDEPVAVDLEAADGCIERTISRAFAIKDGELGERGVHLHTDDLDQVIAAGGGVERDDPNRGPFDVETLEAYGDRLFARNLHEGSRRGDEVGITEPGWQLRIPYLQHPRADGPERDGIVVDVAEDRQHHSIGSRGDDLLDPLADREEIRPDDVAQPAGDTGAERPGVGIVLSASVAEADGGDRAVEKIVDDERAASGVAPARLVGHHGPRASAVDGDLGSVTDRGPDAVVELFEPTLHHEHVGISDYGFELPCSE